MRLFLGLSWSVIRAQRSFSTLKLQNFQRTLEENGPVSDKVPISEIGYAPPSPNCPLNAIVRYILLESGLRVHKYDVLLQHKVPVACKRNKKSYESLFERHGIDPLGSNWSVNEEISVLSSWKNLTQACQTPDPKSIALEFMSIPWRRKESFKKHVLGMYVGQELNRHGNDAFLLWSSLMKTHKSQTFSPEEDRHILRRVEELEGQSSSMTFGTIAKELNRQYPFSIKRRYDLLLKEKRSLIRRRCAFNADEDHLLLQSVLKYGENEDTFETVATQLKYPIDLTKARYYKILFGSEGKSKTKFSSQEQEDLIRGVLSQRFPAHEPDNKFYEDVQKKFKRNPKTLKDHWTKVLLPVIRSHQEGVIHDEWKQSCLKFLLRSMNDPNSNNYNAMSPHELNYPEILETFKGQTRESIKSFLLKVCYQFKDSGEFQNILQDSVNSCVFISNSVSSTHKMYEIVKLYETIKKEIK